MVLIGRLVRRPIKTRRGRKYGPLSGLKRVASNVQRKATIGKTTMWGSGDGLRKIAVATFIKK